MLKLKGRKKKHEKKIVVKIIISPALDCMFKQLKDTKHHGTVHENIIGTPKMRNNYDSIKLIIFQYEKVVSLS